MRIVCNRYNPQSLIDLVQPWGSKMTLAKRWQVSVQYKDGKYYDHFFVAKPTRKQIRKLHIKKVKHYIGKCYECGKRIEYGNHWTLDDLNYAHNECARNQQ